MKYLPCYDMHCYVTIYLFSSYANALINVWNFLSVLIKTWFQIFRQNKQRYYLPALLLRYVAGSQDILSTHPQYRSMKFFGTKSKRRPVKGNGRSFIEISDHKIGCASVYRTNWLLTLLVSCFIECLWTIACDNLDCTTRVFRLLLMNLHLSGPVTSLYYVSWAIWTLGKMFLIHP